MRRQPVGNIRVWWLPACANINAPTVAEINAGVDLTPMMRRDGLSIPRSANMVDASDASDRNNKQNAGTRDVGPISYQGYRDDVAGSDTAWTALPEDAVGWLVVRRFGGSALAPAIGHKVEVYPGEVGSRAVNDLGENENTRFTATIAVTGASTTNATVA